ncbi:MAG: hypothetical protein ACRYGM_06085 [Janthinobacterium lividum]
MQPLRRWVPAGAAAFPAEPSAARQGASEPLRRDRIGPKDMAFVAEFAAHGGQARSSDGFKGEAELVRMHRIGLLDLERSPAAPYAVTGVSLSAAARSMLAGGPADAAPAPHPQPGGPQSLPEEQALRRKGFEVARAMVGAAVKAEIAAWTAQGAPGGPGMLEQRVMSRINQLAAPYPA